MKVGEWREMHRTVTEGVEAYLCRSAPRKARRLLADHRARACAARNVSERRKTDRALERLVTSASYFRAAWRRFILASMFQGIDTLAQLQEQLGNSKRQCRKVRQAAAEALEKIKAKEKAGAAPGPQSTVTKEDLRRFARKDGEMCRAGRSSVPGAYFSHKAAELGSRAIPPLIELFREETVQEDSVGRETILRTILRVDSQHGTRHYAELLVTPLSDDQRQQAVQVAASQASLVVSGLKAIAGNKDAAPEKRALAKKMGEEVQAAASALEKIKAAQEKK